MQLWIDYSFGGENTTSSPGSLLHVRINMHYICIKHPLCALRCISDMTALWCSAELTHRIESMHAQSYQSMCEKTHMWKWLQWLHQFQSYARSSHLLFFLCLLLCTRLPTHPTFPPSLNTKTAAPWLKGGDLKWISDGKTGLLNISWSTYYEHLGSESTWPVLVNPHCPSTEEVLHQHFKTLNIHIN